MSSTEAHFFLDFTFVSFFLFSVNSVVSSIVHRISSIPTRGIGTVFLESYK